MRIGLIDVDGHNFPNLVPMKISTFHTDKGDYVEWVNPLLGEYDIVYQSKVFDFTPDFNTCIKADQIIKGGTGYDHENKLPSEIENCYPDYSLYNIKNTAYGFLTRGCPRGCEFCIVSAKEGKCSKKVADLNQFWKDQKEIKLLDPNLLACNDRIELLDQLIKSKAWIDFTQGLDVRLLDDEVIAKVQKLKIKMIHFAWDHMKDSKVIIKNLENFKKKTNLNYRKLGVYILTNFDTTHEEDLHRVYKLKDLGYNPYVMIYDRDNAPKETRHLQRWVNNRIIFRSCNKFEDYKKAI
ncbi:radical SAM protein [Wukongibacter sp. M2B1]|uniref:radical SAM protein n=1 Tax=Wukongibacter sp. M2B1 TaxID=3088895 RepID=UPI003D79ECAF